MKGSCSPTGAAESEHPGVRSARLERDVCPGSDQIHDPATLTNDANRDRHGLSLADLLARLPRDFKPLWYIPRP